MKFKSIQIKGKGRGKKIGIPTINLKIPKNFNLAFGIYAVWVTIRDKPFKGALHFGPIPQFNQTTNSLEVMLVDVSGEVPESSNSSIEVVVVKKIRDIKKFKNVVELVDQTNGDVVKAREFLVRSSSE